MKLKSNFLNNSLSFEDNLMTTTTFLPHGDAQLYIGLYLNYGISLDRPVPNIKRCPYPPSMLPSVQKPEG